MEKEKPNLAKEWKPKTPEVPQSKEHHTGKGTRARLNTAASKLMFGSRYSK